MPFYIGENKIVDRYIGDKLVIAAYKGETKYFDAYSEITGPLPLTYESRVEHILKNYALYGSSNGSGMATKNIFDPAAKDTSNGFVANARLRKDGVVQSYTGSNVTEYIPITPGTNYYIWPGATLNLFGDVIYDANKNRTRGAEYELREYIGFTAREGEAYVRFTYWTANETTRVALYEDTNSTSFIPHGYQIPLTNTDGTNSQTYPLYIGSTKLGEEEYVDYGEQKVYKRGENAGDWNKATGYNATITSVQNGVTIRSSTGSGSYPSVNFTTRVAGTVDSLGLTAGVTYLVTFNVSDVSTPSADTAKKRFCLRDSANTVVKSDTQALTAEGEHTFTFTFQSGHYLSFLLARSSASQSTSLTITDLKITEFQPTDPPVPFPAISTYKGENTLSSTETVGEVTIKGRINELPTQSSDN